MKFYVVRLGGDLYVSSRTYGLYQSTTNNIQKAYWLYDYDKAVSLCKKTYGGVVEEFELMQAGEKDEQIDTLKLALAQAKQELERLKGEQKNG